MTEIQRAADPPVVALLKQYDDDITAALPNGWTGSRFQATCINLLRATPQLVNVEPRTFIASVLLSAQLGLEPGAPLGLSWIIPRRNKGKLEASFQVGYSGLRQLAYRSGLVQVIEARIVHDGDLFDFSHGLGGTNWKHKPKGEPGREWTAVYCAARLATGGEMFEAMTKAEVEEHRDRYVQGSDNPRSAWKTNEAEMARKTVTARLCRQLPLSVELRNALAADGATPREFTPDLVGVIDIEEEEAADNE